MSSRNLLNGTRLHRSSRGHYESWFQRANHPREPMAFWIRYTIFRPADRGDRAVGEVWFMLFDRDRGGVIARKQSCPLERCAFARDRLQVRVGAATLDQTQLAGAIDDTSWTLRYESPSEPLLMLPPWLYRTPFPRAKLLTGSPAARFSGTLTAAGRVIDVQDWVGSQNHNWGTRHTDRYAWGQVAGFDDAPDVFFEAATAWLRVGPTWTPPLSIVSARMGSHTIQRIGVVEAVRASATLAGFHWRIRSGSKRPLIEATFAADASDVVALRYANPPGGYKVCLNSKLARCSLRLDCDATGPREFHTRHRAAFEVLQDTAPQGLPLLL